ncbi:uncharacterized protein [Penaeus vannamei]|uniref:uncharacterized protein n=1 Tax=Penaeus vannamei TaxID=6689 RepID=UPI00387F3D92
MSFVKDTMNIYSTQSSQILYTEPQRCSSAVKENFSSSEDLGAGTHCCIFYKFSRPAPTPCTSGLFWSSPPPSSPSPEPQQTPASTPFQPKAKRRKTADPLNEQCLEAVKVLINALN